MKRLSIFHWYHVLRGHHQFTMKPDYVKGSKLHLRRKYRAPVPAMGVEMRLSSN
jgi:hypothetical protein